MYASGTFLGNANIEADGSVLLTPASGIGFSFPSNTGTTPITYYIYAIVSPTPTDDICRPFVETTLTVQPNPSVSVTTNSTCNTDGTFNVGITIVESGNFTVEFANEFFQASCGPTIAQNVTATFASIGGGIEDTFVVPEGTYSILITNDATDCRSLIAGPVGETNCECQPTRCMPITLTKN